jgi:hypothetical protein
VFDIIKPISFVLLISSFNCFSQDPMRPPNWSTGNRVEQNSQREILNLQQILSSKNRKVAVINDTLVVEGQIIGGAKVAEITDQSVRVIYQGRSTTLTMTATTKEYNREK